MIEFKELSIQGLFGESDVLIPIQQNRLVLVGYNGIGKSTILNIFYYFISQQWNKLAEQDFSKISVKLKNKNKRFSIEKDDLNEYFHFKRSRRPSQFFQARYPKDWPNLVFKAEEILASRDLDDWKSGGNLILSNSRNKMNVIREQLQISARAAESIIRYIERNAQDELEFDNKRVENLSIIDKFLTENLRGRILYLPTYRRIERDIKTIFPEIEEELQRALTRRSRGHYENENYIELVQFGMEDVKTKISSRLESIKGYALSQINNLTAKYLSDVIRNEADRYGEIEPEEISENSLETVFSKVDSNLLGESDKSKIIDVVDKIRNGEKLEENEKYVAHYVMYLVDIGKNISGRERSIIKFVNICNSYLYGKSFYFDNIEYNVLIKHDSGRPVEMEELSSGEKQIVSLFSHLILDDEDSNYIIIDEPELSLSVDWQQRFLQDISDLETCKLIFAVTHSPFIFDNGLDNHTVDLLEHTSSAQ